MASLRGRWRAPRGAALAALVLLLSVWLAWPAIERAGRGVRAGVARAVTGPASRERVEGYADELRAAAAESGIDPCLLAAVVYVESRGRKDAVSHADALGLTQLKLESAADAARKLGIAAPTRDELLSDSALNLRLGARHLAWLIDCEGPDLERVLVAYNAGRTKLMRWIRAAGGYNAWRAQAQDSDVIAYARGVLELRDEFARRGAVASAARIR